jgi:Beta/Gamma crystallin
MSLKTVMRCTIVLGLTYWTAACHLFPPHEYSGPGCLVYIYSQPGLKGYGLPIRNDSEQLADPWQHMTSSVKVVYGTWRLYSEPDFSGFMGDYKAPADVIQLGPDHHLGSLKCLEPEPEPPKY